MEILLFIITAMSLVGVIGFVIGTMALIEVKALKNSTHKIEWRPIEPPGQETGLDDFMATGEDNKSAVEPVEDDLFYDDIDLFLDPKPRRGKE